jgi:hypothetical protein|tara:strand:+ start:416 stop:1042 length:627 start_codon:yes stop_codon:yes gene_type:complete
MAVKRKTVEELSKSYEKSLGPKYTEGLLARLGVQADRAVGQYNAETSLLESIGRLGVNYAKYKGAMTPETALTETPVLEDDTPVVREAGAGSTAWKNAAEDYASRPPGLRGVSPEDATIEAQAEPSKPIDFVTHERPQAAPQEAGGFNEWYQRLVSSAREKKETVLGSFEGHDIMGQQSWADRGKQTLEGLFERGRGAARKYSRRYGR